MADVDDDSVDVDEPVEADNAFNLAFRLVMIAPIPTYSLKVFCFASDRGDVLLKKKSAQSFLLSLLNRQHLWAFSQTECAIFCLPIPLQNSCGQLRKKSTNFFPICLPLYLN